MTVVSGMNRKLKDALVVILSGLIYGGEPAFVKVLDNTRDEFDGSPIVRVLPGGYSSVTGSSYQMDHTVKFDAIITWPLEDPSNIESSLYNAMYDLTDLVVNAVQHDDHIGELSAIDPTIVNWKMDADKAEWKVAAGKTGALLLCSISIAITYSQDVL